MMIGGVFFFSLGRFGKIWKVWKIWKIWEDLKVLGRRSFLFMEILDLPSFENVSF